MKVFILTMFFLINAHVCDGATYLVKNEFLKSDSKVIATYDEIGWSKIEMEETFVYNPEIAELDAEITLDPYVARNVDTKTQWGLGTVFKYGVNAERAWELSEGEDVLVAVVDTGIDYEHPALKHNIFINTKEIPDNGVDDDENGLVDDYHGWSFVTNHENASDGNGHGTHVSGIIAANNDVYGVAPKVKILPLQFLDQSGRGTTSGAIESILYAAKMGAKVINASFGSTSRSSSLETAIEYAGLKSGAVFVAAAGNDGVNLDFEKRYPASYELPNQITVAAHDKFGFKASFSNFGKIVKISAPGVDIYSTWIDQNYKSISGTSMATPFVAGSAALIFAKYPDYTPEQVIKKLMKGQFDTTMYGWTRSKLIMDAYGALKWGE